MEIIRFDIGPHIRQDATVFFNMLTNVAKVWVNENTKERRRKLS
jgi:hypothetical protein